MGHKPSIPVYNTNEAIGEQERIRNSTRNDLYTNYESGLGGYSWDPETNTIKTNYNQTDKLRLGHIDTGVQNLDLNPDTATETYFQNAMSNIQPEIDRYRSQVSADLINKGIPIGSRAYNQVQEEVDKNINQAVQNAYVDSRSRALSDINAQINNIGGVQSQIYQPQAYAGIGSVGLRDLYNDKFENEMDIYNVKVAERNAKMGSLFNGIGSGIGAAIGGAFGGGMGAQLGSSIGGSFGNMLGGATGNTTQGTIG